VGRVGQRDRQSRAGEEKSADAQSILRSMESDVRRRIERCCSVTIFALIGLSMTVASQDAGQGTSNQQASQVALPAIPAVDAEMGPCSVEFTVTDPSFKPVRDAKVRVHVSYGFMGIRRLDLEVATNADGKARFVGLPNNLKRALYFYAEQGNLRGTAVNDAALKCNASHTLTLRESVDNNAEPPSDDSGGKSPDRPEDKRQP
jgi:hypothetical protein